MSGSPDTGAPATGPKGSSPPPPRTLTVLQVHHCVLHRVPLILYPTGPSVFAPHGMLKKHIASVRLTNCHQGFETVGAAASNRHGCSTVERWTPQFGGTPHCIFHLVALDACLVGGTELASDLLTCRWPAPRMDACDGIRCSQQVLCRLTLSTRTHACPRTSQGHI